MVWYVLSNPAGSHIKTQAKNKKTSNKRQYRTEVGRQQKVKRNNEKSHETTISGKYHKPQIVKQNKTGNNPRTIAGK